ncbi:MAG TPA: DUF2231 domain-containing protein [Candidatus Binatia bacterium]|nr:DUF2231 domain-containing protein [Candidatus Binatia bacterium]
MRTPARIMDHPIHPMLIAFPIGLWVFSLAADITYRVGGDPIWLTMAYWTMLGGTIGALVAAVPGLVDYLSLAEPRAVRLGTVHLTLNLLIVGLFLASLVLRTLGNTTGLPFVLSIIGVGLLLVSGWFGWEMIYRQGVAISPEIEIRARERRGAA